MYLLKLALYVVAIIAIIGIVAGALWGSDMDWEGGDE